MLSLKMAVVVISVSSLFGGIANAHNGDATWYTTGMGNCGSRSKDSDFIVALSTQEYNNGVHCWQRIKVSYEGRTIDVAVVDSCPACSRYGIDLSPGAFQALAPLDMGRIQVAWQYE